jgi:hypothetical protein
MAKPVKQPINFNFAKGLAQKVDPYQVPVGNFEALVNSVFDKVGLLQKRNGFPYLGPALPNTTTSYLTTFNEDLQAIGDNLVAFSRGQDEWVTKGSTHPLKLSVLPLVRNSVNQSYADSATAPNGLVCTAYAEESVSTTVVFKYVIADYATGQNVAGPTALSGADATYGTPRVYVVGNYFVIIYTKHPSAYTLNYLAISWQDTSLTSTAVVASAYAQATTVAWDATNLNNSLYIAYNGASSSGIKMVSLSNLLALGSTVVIDASHQGTVFSVTSDTANQLVWTSYYNLSGTSGYSVAVNAALVTQLSATQIIPSGTILNLASTAQNNTLSFWYEVSNNYSYDSGVPTHFIKGNTLTLGGTLGTAAFTVRSVGLASKAFLLDGVSYFLSAYQSPYQPTYFLIDASTSTSAAPIAIAKLAYGNGGGYLTTGLPNVVLSGDMATVPYLFKDLVEAVNKNTNVPAGSQVNGIYSQTGVNQATFEFTTSGIASAEIGSNLNLTGGFLWMYDGFVPVENNFFLWPDSIEATWSTSGGSIHAQPNGSTNTNAYYYQVTYEWTDNQGNAFRSAPSIPISVTTTGSGTSGSITVNIPTLRLTYKVTNPLKICIYRWSVAQQSYYQTSSIVFQAANSLTLNDTTVDSVAFVDTLADATILGNNLLYTTGGVVEDISPPASNILALFDDRLWLVDAEDPNLLWYSKQVIEATPVEMSDLFTFYVAPSTGSEGSTGDITALYPMDDKLIIFKTNAIYYINGIGPDNTGANNGYSQPIFITSSVGCSNPRSIALMPSGLMFQSNKGIWLLARDTSTAYIGAGVDSFNDTQVVSATVIPGTNQVRFGLNAPSVQNTSHLMYDYFVGEWGTFQGIPSLHGTLYNDLHTIVNQYGQVSQEEPDTYLDGTLPVLMSFTTAWLQLAGLRGYMRAFWFSYLGTYLSPHKLQTSIAYDFNSSAKQSNLIMPLNYSVPYGDDPFYGGDGTTAYGGPVNIEQERVFFERQRCKSVQITMAEVFDPSFGTVAGPGLTLSGISCQVGLKSSYQPLPQQQSVG